MTCALCGGATSPVYEVRDIVLETPGTWTFAQCAVCGHGQLQPMPGEDELRAFYGSVYTPERTKAIDAFFHSPLGRAQLRRRYRALLRAGLSSTARVLDVGCGTGIFLHYLRERAPSLVRAGLDTSAMAAEVARAADPEATISVSPLEGDVAPGPFDLLAVNHVLEHVRDPEAFLADCRRRLEPGGLLLVEVPRQDGWGRRLFGRWWWNHLPPQHLHLFHRDGLAALLRRAGFSEPLAEVTAPVPLLVLSTLVLVVRYTVGSRSPYARNWLVRGPVVAAGLLALPGVIAFDLVMGPILGWLGLGDVLTFVVRKQEGVGSPVPSEM